MSFAKSVDPVFHDIHCAGTEPFWSLSVHDMKGSFNLIDKKIPVEFKRKYRTIGHVKAYLLGMNGRTIKGESTQAFILNEKCTNDMLTQRYNYTILYMLDKDLYKGCCKTA